MDGTTPIWAAARIILGEREADFSRRLKSALRSWELDDIHDLRVASRRLREGLTLFAPVYDAEELGRVQKTVKRVTSALGELRNTDEALRYFAGLRERLPGPEREEISRLMDDLAATRLQGQEQLHDRLGRHLSGRLRRSIRRFIQVPRIFTAPPPADPCIPFAHLARTAERQRFEPIVPLLAQAVLEENKEARHKLRIAVKRYRYRLELLAPLLGPDFAGIHAEVRSYQDMLGSLHDLEVFAAMVAAHPFTEEARDSITATMSREHGTLYMEFLTLTERCPLPELGQRVETLLA